VKVRHPNSARWFNDVEEAQLRRLVNDAYDVRESGYVRDAVDAIVEWRERTWPDRLERHARRQAS
jgi:hypothetical protein